MRSMHIPAATVDPESRTAKRAICGISFCFSIHRGCTGLTLTIAASPFLMKSGFCSKTSPVAGDKITNEPHIPTFVHSEYAFLGLLGKLLNINSVLTYHLSRLLLGGIFLVVAFFFFLNFFKFSKIPRPMTSSLIAFFLAFFVGGFPHVSLKPFTIEPYLS